MSSHVALKTLWILISWLLQKPADLDLHCLQESLYLVLYYFPKSKLLKHRKVICFGQVKFSLDKYNYGHLLDPGQVKKVLLFPHTVIGRPA